MRRKRERLHEQLGSLTVACLAVYITWVWARLTPPPVSSGGAAGALPYTINVLARTVADSLMLPVLIATPILALMWVALIRRSRNEMRRDQAALTLRALSPDRFEDWCAARFRDLGYEVRVVGGQGDHGIDLIATRGAEKVGVQCRRFAQHNAVTEPQLRDLYGAMHSIGATRAVMVTTGRYTSAAAAWVRGKPIDLWGPEELSAVAPTTAILPPAGSKLSQVATDLMGKDSALGPCPVSRSALTIRTNRRTGDRFIGCTDYPRCKYTRPLTASQ